MAIGDKAAAKGLVVYASTQAHSLGYQNDDQRGDDIADEIDARYAADLLLSGRLNTLEADTGWIAFTPNAGWVANATATFGTLAYRKKGGVLYLRGSAQYNTGGATVLSLPSGYRPAFSVQVPVPNFPGNAAYMTIKADGSVSIDNITLVAGNIFQLTAANGIILN